MLRAAVQPGSLYSRVTPVGLSDDTPPFITMNNQHTAKAPGKVLLAGGYGVLQQGNVGLSLAVDKYFFAVTNQQAEVGDRVLVRVASPQLGLKWEYELDPNTKFIHELHGQTNPFLENAIKFSLLYANTLKPHSLRPINITILQDRGFLSEGSSVSSGRFINYGEDATKTGLGSSAGVLVVTVSALLGQLLGNISLQTVNAVSQVANLAAQGKIGSNFDISTAVFGSHAYINLLPRTAFLTASSLDFKPILAIDPQVQPFIIGCEHLKHGYCCMLDLKKGSNTRKMVSGFIKALTQLTPEVSARFYSGSKGFVQAVCRLLKEEKALEVVTAGLKQVNKEYRAFLQEYSALTGVPVEPPEFKSFLDQICSLPNVVYAICPGSGGYDAIFVLSSAQTPQDITQLRQKLNVISQSHGVDVGIDDTTIVWGNVEVTEQDRHAIEQYLTHS